MKTSLFYFLTIFLCIHSFCYAQSPIIQLSIKGKDTNETKIIDSLSYQNTFKNFTKLKTETNRIYKKLQKLGYIDLKNKSLQKTSDSTFLNHLLLRNRYQNITISYNNAVIPSEIIKKLDSKTNTTDNTFTIPFTQTEKTLQHLTNYLVDQGNVFSNLSLSDLRKKGNRIFATLIISKSQIRKIDNITIKGYSKFPTSYLKHNIRLKKGKTFNKRKLIKKSEAINNLAFAKNLKPPEILFNKDSTTIYLYISKKPANTFDGFLGFSSDTENRDLKLNGYINLSLTNNLNYGEQLNIVYKSDGNEQQRFNADIFLPYIFKSPLGVQASLNIFKKDSSFLNTDQSIHLNYLIKDKSTIFIGYKTSKSNNLLKAPNPLLNINNYNASFFTAGFKQIRKQNKKLFPIKSEYALSVELGTRKTDTETINQTKGLISLNHIFNLNDRNSVFLSNSSAIIFSDNLFTNELYRFGGINSIRGFEENSINASLFNVFTTEYRYLLSSNLYIHTITDYSYFENNINNLYDNLTSLGFGFGINTQTGLFKIIFANGKNSQQNFKFSNTKVHISLNANF